MCDRYLSAKEKYAKFGIDTEAVLAKIATLPVSLHCWQGDDVIGFDHDGPLTGGIQTTGNYPGKARTPEQLIADMEKVISLCPGAKKINVHACYAIFEEDGYVDRDKIEPRHFKKWVDLAKKYGMGLDFNPTFFSHPKVKDGLTLSSPDEATRKFWIEHGKACIRISKYFAEETGIPCVMNIWTGDGFKDIPADRMGPRMRYKESIEAILSEPYDFAMVKPCVESKVFGIGVESFDLYGCSFHHTQGSPHSHQGVSQTRTVGADPLYSFDVCGGRGVAYQRRDRLYLRNAEWLGVGLDLRYYVIPFGKPDQQHSYECVVLCHSFGRCFLGGGVCYRCRFQFGRVPDTDRRTRGHYVELHSQRASPQIRLRGFSQNRHDRSGPFSHRGTWNAVLGLLMFFVNLCDVES